MWLHTFFESRPTDARHAVRNGDGGQATTARESRPCNSCSAFFQNDFRVIRHCSFISICYHSRINNAVFLTAIPRCAPESITTDIRHAVWDGNGGQATAVLESITTDSHAVWDGNGGQATAALESTNTNDHHAVWDGNGGQATAVLESTSTNDRHAVWDGNGGQATTSRVFRSD